MSVGSSPNEMLTVEELTLMHEIEYELRDALLVIEQPPLMLCLEVKPTSIPFKGSGIELEVNTKL